MAETTQARTTFNEIADLYDRVRPRYPDRLFDEMIAMTGLRAGARILEIGSGTGIATRSLAERGFHVVGIELGENMAAVARRKLATFANVELQVAAFEDWQVPEASFDLVIAATAFHWLDRRMRYQKAALALRPGGHLSIITYRHAAGADEGFFDRVQACYERHMPGTPSNLLFHNVTHADFRQDTADPDASEYFGESTMRRFIAEETYTRAQYLDLLLTYSDHWLLEAPNREKLFACIGSLIDLEFGGRVRKRYLHEVAISQRRE